MKAHRRMLAVATMALAATVMAGPAYAGEPAPDVEVDAEVSSSPTCVSSNEEGDRSGAGVGLGLIGVGVGYGEILNLDNVLNCTPILSDIHVLSNHG